MSTFAKIMTVAFATISIPLVVYALGHHSRERIEQLVRRNGSRLASAIGRFKKNREIRRATRHASEI